MMKGLRSVGLIAAAGLAFSSTTAFADELRIVLSLIHISEPTRPR